MMKDCLKTMTTPLARCTFFQECLHHDISLMLDTTSSFNKYAVENKWVELSSRQESQQQHKLKTLLLINWIFDCLFLHQRRN